MTAQGSAPWYAGVVTVAVTAAAPPPVTAMTGGLGNMSAYR